MVNILFLMVFPLMLASMLLASLDFPVVFCGPAVAVVLSARNISKVAGVATVDSLFWPFWLFSSR
jgi:hypothetical protein